MITGRIKHNTPLLKETYKRQIEDKALQLGFSDVGFAVVDRLHDEEHKLKGWLDAGYNAGMEYMANNFEKRVDPSLLVPGAKTVISLLLNYYPKEKQHHDDAPKVSKYAYGKDYHFTVKDKLKQLFNFIKEEIYPDLEGRLFVDSAPVLDRAWAVQSGLGWIGKNTNLINKKLGSFVFIGELIINLDLPVTKEPVKDSCGSCTLCIDACPTNALVDPHLLDANRCISYLTIENRGDIPDEFIGKFENWIFGCDICQDVCPWNRKLSPNDEPDFQPSDDFLSLTKEDWSKVDEKRFEEIFSQSPLKRTKYTGLKRNIEFLKKR